MPASGNTVDDPNPAVVALRNCLWAVMVCAGINLVCGWGVDWINECLGKPPMPKAPSWTGTLIVGGQHGWPVLCLAVLCGLFRRNSTGLTPMFVSTYFLGLIDPIASLVVGIVLVLSQRAEVE